MAENVEVVAVEDLKDVGNILGKSWVGLLNAPSLKCVVGRKNDNRGPGDIKLAKNFFT